MKRDFFIPLIFATIAGACTGSRTSASNTAPGPVPVSPPTASTVPVISDLSAHFSDSSCTRAADGLKGRALILTFDYADGGADLNGGHVMLTRQYNSGRSEWHSAPIPTEVMLSGSPQKGEAEIDDACPLFDNNSSETETVTLVDASGDASNSLSVMVDRPAGAP